MSLMTAGASEQKQIDFKSDAYLFRQVCWIIYQCNVDPKKAVKDIEAFWPLEKQKKLRRPTQAYLQKKAKELEARLNAKQNG